MQNQMPYKIRENGVPKMLEKGKNKFLVLDPWWQNFEIQNF